MDIKNVTQFKHFIMGRGLIESDPAFKNVYLCIEDYNRACSGCGSDVDKRRIYEKCNRLYAHAVNNVLPRFLSKVFESIPDPVVSFYRESEFIKSFRR